MTRSELEQLSSQERDLIVAQAMEVISTNNIALWSDPTYKAILKRLKVHLDSCLKYGLTDDLKRDKNVIWLDFDIYLINKASQALANGVA